MAIARLCMTNALLRSSPAMLTMQGSVRGLQKAETRRFPFLRCSYSTEAAPSSSDQKEGGQVAVKEEEGSSSLAKSRRGLKLSLPWKNPFSILPFRSRNTAPSIQGLNSLGNALVQVSENLNKLVENWAPSRLFGRVKEDDNCYKLRYEVPGFSKKDLKITVEDGFLVITGERKVEDGDFDDDEEEGWYAQRYGYYNTSLLLPEDAKVEEIKAEVKDGLLYITIPRTGDKKKSVRVVEIS